ncbi:MAG: HupE/UreJ family protein [Verrucomicrobiales bacterium]|jgi:hydrogenase/urease accessory protein HupE|nr:HupE/UreJ family protein [Verrucomicrobiales bacterium]
MHRRRLFLHLLILHFVLFWANTRVEAHDPGLSAIKVFVRSNEISAEMVFSRTDIESLFPIDKNQDGKISPEEFAAAKDRLGQLASGALLITLDGQPSPVANVHLDLDNDNNCSFVILFSGSPLKQMKVESRIIQDLPAGHRQVISLFNVEKKLVEEKLCTAKNNSVNYTFDDAAPEPEPPSGFVSFFGMGVEHILTGYDHLLFLFGLLIVCTRVGTIAKVVTCFTLAHSITLALAATRLMTINSRFVEPAIALSILYVGIENIVRKGEPRGRAIFTFCFGLIHGFGFASALEKRHIGENGKGILVPLISFNLGVETGQIVVACIVLPIIWQLRKKPWFLRYWVPALSFAVALAGLFWFIQRVWF